MIKKIGIKNYKAFRDFNEFDIKPITIFVGPNSSGKSSLIKFLSYLQPKNSVIGLGRFPLEDIYNKSNTFCKNDLPIEVKIEFEKGSHLFSGNYEFKKDQIEGRISKINNHAPNSSNNIDNIDGIELSFCNWEHPIAKWKTIKEKTIEIINTDYVEEVNILNKYLVGNKSKNYRNIYYFLDEILLWIFEGNFNDDAYVAFNCDFFDIDISHTSDVESGIGSANINAARKNMRRDLDTFSLLYENIEGLSDLIYELQNKLCASQINDSRNIFAIIFSRVLNNPLFTEQKLTTVVEMLCITICSTILENVCNYYRSNYSDKIKSIEFNRSMNSFPKFISNKPLRAFPRNFYTETEIKENFNLLEYNNEFDKKYSELIREVNVLLGILGINYSFILKSIEHKDLNESLLVVQIKDNITDEEYHFNDVGFGLSQIIPIIFSISSYGSDRLSRKVFLVEQPEIHLHPKQQVKLSELFYAGLRFKTSPIYKEYLFGDDLLPWYDESSEIIGQKHDTNDYFVIETHSEHLVRGFQVLVAEGKLFPDDIGIYYIDRNSDGASTIKRIELNETGLFKEEFPKGFFDNSYNLTKKLLLGGK